MYHNYVWINHKITKSALWSVSPTSHFKSELSGSPLHPEFGLPPTYGFSASLNLRCQLYLWFLSRLLQIVFEKSLWEAFLADGGRFPVPRKAGRSVRCHWWYRLLCSEDEQDLKRWRHKERQSRKIMLGPLFFPVVLLRKRNLIRFEWSCCSVSTRIFDMKL